jgi:hypothetical protein
LQGGHALRAVRILPFCFFNEETTEAGIACLGYYHEKKDEQHAAENFVSVKCNLH